MRCICLVELEERLDVARGGRLALRRDQRSQAVELLLRDRGHELRVVRAFERAAHESALVDQRAAHRRDDRLDLWIDKDELLVGEQRERFARRRAADAERGRYRRLGQGRAWQESSAHDRVAQCFLDLLGVRALWVESKILQRGCKHFLLTGVCGRIGSESVASCSRCFQPFPSDVPIAHFFAVRCFPGLAFHVATMVPWLSIITKASSLAGGVWP